MTVGTAGWRGSVSLLPATVTAFTDTFTGTDNTNLTAHAPDSPSGLVWVLSGGFTTTVKVFSNQARLNSSGGGSNTRMAITSDLVDDLFELACDYVRGSSDVSGDYADLEFLALTGSGIPTDRVALNILRASSTTVDLSIRRRFGGSVVQNVVIALGVSLALSGSLRFGCTVAYPTVTVWTEPAGGGLRTLQGTATLTADYRDGLHKRIAFNFADNHTAGSGSPKIDNLTIRGMRIGEITNWQLEVGRPALDARSFDSTGVTEIVDGSANWMSLLRGLYISANAPAVLLRRALVDKAAITLTMKPTSTGTGEYQGQGRVTNWRVGAPTDDAVRIDATVEGLAALTYTT